MLLKRVSASDQETRDRAERGSAVRGLRPSERTRVAAPPPTDRARCSSRCETAVLLIRLSNAVKLQGGFMVAVAQLVRAPVCGTGGCGFNSRQPPL